MGKDDAKSCLSALSKEATATNAKIGNLKRTVWPVTNLRREVMRVVSPTFGGSSRSLLPSFDATRCVRCRRFFSFSIQNVSNSVWSGAIAFLCVSCGTSLEKDTFAIVVLSPSRIMMRKKKDPKKWRSDGNQSASSSLSPRYLWRISPLPPMCALGHCSRKKVVEV